MEVEAQVHIPTLFIAVPPRPLQDGPDPTCPPPPRRGRGLEAASPGQLACGKHPVLPAQHPKDTPHHKPCKALTSKVYVLVYNLASKGTSPWEFLYTDVRRTADTVI